jgi:hypothetical protein
MHKGCIGGILEAQVLETRVGSLPEKSQPQVKQMLLRLLQDAQREGNESEETTKAINNIGGWEAIARGIMDAHKTCLKEEHVREAIHPAAVAASSPTTSNEHQIVKRDFPKILIFPIVAGGGLLSTILIVWLLRSRVRDWMTRLTANIRLAIQAVLDAIPRF